jgi:hypothetical protein
VTATPARATRSTNTLPEIIPGSDVHAKFAVDAWFACTVTVCEVVVHEVFDGAVIDAV